MGWREEDARRSTHSIDWKIRAHLIGVSRASDAALARIGSRQGAAGGHRFSGVERRARSAGGTEAPSAARSRSFVSADGARGRIANVMSADARRFRSALSKAIRAGLSRRRAAGGARDDRSTRASSPQFPCRSLLSVRR
jgi:hypothetical protein